MSQDDRALYTAHQRHPTRHRSDDQPDGGSTDLYAKVRSVKLAPIVARYQARLLERFAQEITVEQRSALQAITGCRTEQYGALKAQCGRCQEQQSHYHSCGHRSCPSCLHHTSREWLDRQSLKLVPGEYFLVTFTLPYELRALAQQHPEKVYGAMMVCTASTLNTFAKNDKQGIAQLGMTSVLHTHTRKLDYHPHVHILIPAGGMGKDKQTWRKRQGNYLFNGRALGKVFRARLLEQLNEMELPHPKGIPQQWVVDCRRMGEGLPALKYLSLYLYRGVISEESLIWDNGESICFQYQDSLSKALKTRTMRGEDFLYLLLQHVLPKGFRRTRDYGFLHGNAKARLKQIQWALKVVVPKAVSLVRSQWACRHCGEKMRVIAFCQRVRSKRLTPQAGFG